jgi:hypothetical protein
MIQRRRANTPEDLEQEIENATREIRETIDRIDYGQAYHQAPIEEAEDEDMDSPRTESTIPTRTPSPFKLLDPPTSYRTSTDYNDETAYEARELYGVQQELKHGWKKVTIPAVNLTTVRLTPHNWVGGTNGPIEGDDPRLGTNSSKHEEISWAACIYDDCSRHAGMKMMHQIFPRRPYPGQSIRMPYTEGEFRHWIPIEKGITQPPYVVFERDSRYPGTCEGNPEWRGCTENQCLIHYQAKIHHWNKIRHEQHLKDQEMNQYNLENHRSGLGREALRRAEDAIRALDPEVFRINTFMELFEEEYKIILDEDRTEKARGLRRITSRENERRTNEQAWLQGNATSQGTTKEPNYRAKIWDATMTRRDAMTKDQQEETDVRETYKEEYAKHISTKSKKGKSRQ